MKEEFTQNKLNRATISTIVLIVGMLLTKILSLLKDMALSWKFGAGVITDSYAVVSVLPNILFGGIAVAFATNYVAIYGRMHDKKGKSISLFTNWLILIIGILSVAMSLLVFGFPKIFVKLFASGFEEEAFRISTELVRISACSVAFLGLSSILQGFLQAKENFWAIAFINFPSYVCILVSIICSNEENIYILGLGLGLAYFLDFVWGWVLAKRTGFKLLWLRIDSFREVSQEIKIFFIIAFPSFLSLIISDLNVAVDKTVASLLESGTVSVLDYANKVSGIIFALIANPIAKIIFPKFALMNTDDMEQRNLQIATLYDNVCNKVLLIVIPASVGVFVLASPIVKLLFMRGAFGVREVELTANALKAYIMSGVAISVRIILEKIYFANCDTKTPMKNSLINLGMNVGLNILLVKILGYIGLAIATTLSAFISLVLFYLGIKKHNQYFCKKKNYIETLRIILSAVLMGLFCNAIYSFLYDKVHDLVILIVSVVLGAIIYGICLVLLKSKEINAILSLLRRKQ